MVSKGNFFFQKNILKITSARGKKSNKFQGTLVSLNLKFLFFVFFLFFSRSSVDFFYLLKSLQWFFHLRTFFYIKNLIIYLNKYIKHNYIYNWLNFFFFTYKNIFQQIEFCAIPNDFWFNFTFLLKKTFFLSYFLILLEKVFIKINSIPGLVKDKFFSDLQNLLFLSTYKQTYFMLKKLFTGLFFNKTKVICKNEIYWIFEKTLVKIFLKNWFKKSILLFKKYESYWAFLNTSMYLVRSFFLLNCLPTTSFNFLLLWNFNWIFFWIGDPYKIFSFEELFFWSRQSFLFWNYLPYTAYNYQTKNLFLQPDHKMLFENSKIPTLVGNQNKFLINNDFFSCFSNQEFFQNSFFFIATTITNKE